MLYLEVEISDRDEIRPRSGYRNNMFSSCLPVRVDNMVLIAVGDGVLDLECST